MHSVDVIVLGGGIAGCMAAKEAAEHGLRAAIVERRGFLGWELTATGQTYMQNGLHGDALPLLAGSLKKRLMAEQLALGNVPLLFAQAAAIGIHSDTVTGVLLGNAYGTQYLPARAVIDTEGLAQTLLGGGAAPRGHADAIFHMEVDGIGYAYQAAYDVDPGLGLGGNAIQIHPLLRDHAVTVAFRCPVAAARAANGKAKLDLYMRGKAYSLMRWLRGHISAFADARLVALAPEARCACVCGAAQPHAKRLYPVRHALALQPGTADIDALRAAVSQALGPLLTGTKEDAPAPTAFRSGETTIPAGACTLSPFDDRGMEVPLQAVHFDPACIRARVRADVLVAGAGTSGAMAARALLEGRTDFVLVDANSQPGGTSTVGGVASYWHGHRGGINPSIDEAVARASAQLCGEEKATSKPGLAYYLHTLLEARHDRCYLGLTLCGSLYADGRVRGAYAASDTGLVAFDAQFTLDMTGEGTIAALAGLPYAFGDPHDGMTQSYSQWGRETWSARSFHDVRTTGDPDAIHQDRYSELLRGTYLGHCRNSDWDFSPMPTARESRRVLGEYCLTLKDILEQRAFDDTVCVTNTPFDAHGLGSSPLCDMRIIVCKEPLLARIPLRCYIPKDTDGLLVGGKAFSGTRDAVCVCRMNADLRNAGFMLGMAAEMAIRAGCDVRGIDIAALQRRLAGRDILPGWTWDKPAPIDYTLADGHVSLARVLVAGTLADGARAALGGADPAGRDIVLAWYGDGAALQAVAQRLTVLAARGGMTGKADEAQVCRCLTVLGRTADARWLPTLVAAAMAARASGPAQSENTMYHRSRVDYWRVPNYMALLALARACARMAHARLAAPLAALLADPHIAGYVSPNRHALPRPYFCAYLEVLLSCALARCGGREGYRRLAAYTADARYQLSQMAHDTLTALTGRDLGYDPPAWAGWIDSREGFAAKPLQTAAAPDDFCPA